MIRNRLNYLMLAAAAACGTLACDSGGVGDPCIPEDEYRQDFNGFQVQEVNVESRSFQCETRVCIVNHFQGRVSCPYGQTEAMIPSTESDDDGIPQYSTADGLPPEHPLRCRVPGSDGLTCSDDAGNIVPCGAGARTLDAITVPVDAQKIFRSATDTVYCSCRCAGPPNEKNARYCECPSGYVCEELVRDVGVEGRGQLIGSYCIKPNTAFRPGEATDPNVCDPGIAGSNSPEVTEFGGQGRRRNTAEVCGVSENGEARNPPL